MINFFKESNNAHTMIIGLTGSGKTTMYFEHLIKDKIKYLYDDLYVFSGNYEPNKDIYESLHLEDKLRKERIIKIYHGLVKGDYDEFLMQSFFKKWFINKKTKDIPQLISELSNDQKDILVSYLEQNLEYTDDEEDQRRIFKKFSEDKLKYIYDSKLLYPNEKWVIIFDDLGYNKKFKKSQVMEELLMNGRKRGITAVLLVQKFVSLPSTLRSQFSACIFYYNSNRLEQQSIYKCMGSGSEKQFIDKIFDHFATLPKHSFLFIKMNESDPNNKCFFNFETTPFKLKE
jgi:hypothetical protein